MKNQICALIIFVLFFAGSAFADQATSSMTAVVNVSGSFFLMVNSDSFDFASMLPGQTGEMTRAEGVTVTAASAGGDPWYLKVTAERPLSSGSDQIPNENFTWNGSSEGKGTWNGSNDRNFAEETNTAYISTPDESGTGAKIANRFKFRLNVPEDTHPGNYTTTIMFTMTE